MGYVTYASPKFYHTEGVTPEGQIIWREHTNCFAVLHVNRLHLGYGRSPLQGWINLDLMPGDGVDVVADLDVAGDRFGKHQPGLGILAFAEVQSGAGRISECDNAIASRCNPGKELQAIAEFVGSPGLKRSAKFASEVR